MRIGKWIVRGLGILLLGIVALAVVSALVNRRLPTRSEPQERLSEAEKARAAEFRQVWQGLGDAVWPGLAAVDVPLLLYNERYAFLLGVADPPPGWIKVPQGTPRGGAWEPVPGDAFAGEPYARQTLPASGETPEAFTVQVGDRWVASMPTKTWMEIRLAAELRDGLPPFLAPVFPYPIVTDLFIRGSDGYVSLLVHEAFHAYQGAVAPGRLAAAERATRGEASYPWADEALAAAWQIELDILAEALRAEGAEATADLARQFLAQRAGRREAAALDVTLVDYERQREWLEGLARYAELEIWRQAGAAEGYEPVAALRDDPEFSDYTTFERRWRQEIDQIGRMARDEGDGRFYYSGMAQAVLLDRLQPDWKAGALADGVFLEDLLAQAVAWGESPTRQVTTTR